jgi:hypothetical protein
MGRRRYPTGLPSGYVHTFPAVPFTVVGATDVFTATGHGLANGEKARVYRADGAPALPSPLRSDLDDSYYVRDVSGNTFKLALTRGGAAIDVAADGSGLVMKTGSNV